MLMPISQMTRQNVASRIEIVGFFLISRNY